MGLRSNACHYDCDRGRYRGVFSGEYGIHSRSYKTRVSTISFPLGHSTKIYRFVSCRRFGLILLPLVSHGADGTINVVHFARTAVRRLIGYGALEIPSELANVRAIDLSIQFTLFWMPFVVLLAWWTNSPLTLLFGMLTPFSTFTDDLRSIPRL
jgi:hypothetical protein